MTSQPSVSVIIVNYNTRDATIECIESVFAEGASTGEGPAPLDDLTVIVVDNGSVDGSADAIRQRFPAAIVIEAGENLGFARGVNRGVEASTDEYVLLLNPDTVVIPGSLRALVSFAVRHPDYGLYGGRTLRPDGSVDPSSCWGEPTLWSLTSFALGLSTAFKRSMFFDPESLGNWKRDTVRQVPIVTGCLALIRRDTWSEIGGMDERFFLYGEDAEFSVRARRFGLRPVIVPSAVIVHDVGGSTADAGRKMSLVMAGKATLLRSSWTPLRARIGVALLQLGALVRALLEIGTGSGKRTWRVVWGSRAAWRPGYPDAETALFGRTRPVGASAPEGSTPPKRKLRIEAEPAFRTRHANPYNARLYTAMHPAETDVRDLSYLRLLLRQTDIVHLHWPELTFLSGHRRWRHAARLAFFFSFLSIARLRGAKLIWTVHNISSHENRSTPRIRVWYSRLLFANVDGILSLTTDGIAVARAAYPQLADVPAFVTPHGHYRDDYDFSATKAEAREALGAFGAGPADAAVFLSVGQIRTYKNVPNLVDVFARRAMRVPTGAQGEPDQRELLAIAGRPADAGLRAALTASASQSDSVLLDLQFLPDDRLATWLRAADVVILPYSRIQNSGSAILALSADRPVVVPRIGAMRELQEQVGADWVYTYKGELTAQVLDDVAAWLRDTERGVSPDLTMLAWPTIASQTVAAYRTVLGQPL